MAEPNKAATFSGAGQPQETPIPAQNAAQPQFVTLDEARRVAQEAAEEAFRRAQSLMGKTQDGFEKRVQAELKSLEKTLTLQKAAGMQITPEQEAAMRSQVINQSFLSEAQPTQAQPGAPAAQPESEREEPPNPETAVAWALMEEAGVDIEITDPEFTAFNLDKKNLTLRQFLDGVQGAITAKQARLSQPGQPTQPTTPPRTPTNAGGAGAPARQQIDPKNLDGLFGQAFGGK